MSEIAGNTAILKAGDLLAASNGRSTMLGGISGVRPSTVVIIGAGTVGEFAARAAMGLGAQVKISTTDSIGWFEFSRVWVEGFGLAQSNHQS